MKLQRRFACGAAAAALIALLLCSTARAQDLSKAAESLNLVPADAASYTVMLRNKEQIQAIANSKAWQSSRSCRS